MSGEDVGSDTEEVGEELLRDGIDKEIMNLCQSGFPLVTRPFEEWASRLGIDEEELISRLRRLEKEGAVSRFGPVVNTRALGGSSTLVAASVPEDRLQEVAEQLNERPQISHNYRRDHELNLWFVISAGSEGELEEVLEEIREEFEPEFYNFPTLEEYYIGVNFNF